MINKQCIKCKEFKPFEEFPMNKTHSKNKTYWETVNWTCKTCINLKRKEWRKSNPQKTRNHALKSRLKRRYGISVDDYNTMLNSQNGKCNICGQHHTEFKRKLAVNRDQTTGKIKDLLCANCGVTLKKLSSNTDVFLKMIDYVRKMAAN